MGGWRSQLVVAWDVLSEREIRQMLLNSEAQQGRLEPDRALNEKRIAQPERDLLDITPRLY